MRLRLSEYYATQPQTPTERTKSRTSFSSIITRKITTNKPKTPSASAKTSNNDINLFTQLSETPAPNPFTHSPSTPSSLYLAAARQSFQVKPSYLPTMVHYGVKRNHQLRVQISHKMTNTPPSHTQTWIDTLSQDMVAKTLVTIEESPRKILVNPWDITWIPFQDGKVGVPTIKFFTNKHGKKDPEVEATSLSWSNRRALLDRANFSTRDKDGTRDAKLRRVNLRLLYNGTKEDGNSLRRLLQDNVFAFHPKDSGMEIQTVNLSRTLQSGFYYVQLTKFPNLRPCQ